MPTTPKRRHRATALVIQNGKYLLVRDKGKKEFSLPGGGIEKGEAVLTAACRELGEELGLKAYQAERRSDLDFEGGVTEHKVVRVHAGGKPRRNDGELAAYQWWNGKDQLPLFNHVTAIISRYEKSAGG